MEKNEESDAKYIIDIENRLIMILKKCIKKNGIGNMAAYEAEICCDGEKTPAIIKCKKLAFIENEDEDHVQPLSAMHKILQHIVERKPFYTLKIRKANKSTFSEKNDKTELLFEEELEKTINNFSPKILTHGTGYYLYEKFAEKFKPYINECIGFIKDPKNLLSKDTEKIEKITDNPYEVLDVQYQVFNKKQHVKYTAIDQIYGFSLNELLFSWGAFETSISKAIFYSLTLQLIHLHSKGIAHLNIKLDHVLCDKITGESHLIGFGISRDCLSRQDSIDYQKEIIGGTPPYCPNEIYSQSFRSLLEVDIFSLGVLLFALIYCRFPFAESLEAQTLFRHISRNDFTAFWKEHIEFAEKKGKKPYQDKDFINLLNGMFSKEPENRLTLSEIISHPWVTEGRASANEVQIEIVKRSRRYEVWLKKKELEKSKEKPIKEQPAEKMKK